MQSRYLWLRSCVGIFMLAFCGVALATPPTPPAEADPMAEMMAKWAQYATPGPQHELLAKKVGTWDHHVKMWCDMNNPDAPPMETTGMTETKMILGGRFLLDQTTGEFNGEKFEGMGLSGYDNLKKKFMSIWVDTMSTGVMSGEGTVDDTGKILTYTSQYMDPMTGLPKTSRTVETHIDDDTWKMEMYETGPDGNERKSFEIVYKRRK